MKKKCFVLLAFLVLFLSTYITSVAQLDGSQIINSCNYNNTMEAIYPIKPPVTTEGVGYIRIIIVYVMFNNETKLSGPNNTDQDWPINTTNGPNYYSKMLAENKNDIPDWWNAYDPDNQMISSWFCENSRGQTHVIGKEYFIKLPMSAQDYIDNFNTQAERETEINNYIYWYLDNHYHVTWSDFDNWNYNQTMGWSPGPDHAIDMIYKIHRYSYYELDTDKPIFTVGSLSGRADLGFGSNVSGITHLYELTYNSEVYRIIGCFPYGYGYASSGVTIVGNTTSGVFNQLSALGRLMHENGHYFFNCDGGHSYVGMMGDIWDLSFSPWEKMALGYITPEISNWQNNGYQEIILDDISARTTNGKYLIEVKTPADFDFMLASRYKVSRWDRPMLGDKAAFNIDAPGGEGVYIYHNNSHAYSYSNTNIDIECADGLFRWIQTGYDAPDWNLNNPVLCVLEKTEVVRNFSDDGVGRNINDPTYQNAVKDGLTVRGIAIPAPGKPPPICQKWFSKGKKSTDGGCGWDRIETNTTWENWTSREFAIDRWDAWKPGYNEIFSPYSSPSTITHNYENSITGTFIWIKEHNNTTHQTTVRIYRDAVYNEGGISETDILAATPPSRPMGIKTDYHFVSETLCHPKITWVNNTEPDVINQTTGKIKYKLYRAIKYYMDQIPGPPVLIENNLEFYPNGTPTYIDYQIIGCHSILSSGEPWLYPVRYWVKVVDNSNDESVFSDFTSAIGINDGSIPIGSGGDNFVLNRNIPKTFDLKQNYPNPFNPITNIKYDLPKDIFVTVKIYDLLGREIKTLVNEFKNAGSYLVSFNGSELASGIYFYRIQVVDPTGRAGNFVQVKRMVLIK